MLRIITGLLVLIACSVPAFAQAAKGVDKQSERVRDGGSERTPANNGNKTDVGTGRGIDFGRGKSSETPPLPNPYRLSGRRDVIIKAIQDLIRDQKMVVDESASRLSDGIIVTQPFTFTKGAVVSEAELSRYANVPDSGARGWTRGRYTLTVEVQPIDGSTANIAVNAKVEGRTDGATGAEWTTLRSSGLAEDEFLDALVLAVTGAPPPGRTIQPQP
ncbi:MAG TPA: hypothetical protein VN659_09165 [Pyrinomonadaceae bacterium]|jgi:hypothetical protein|nr:hypothetical protein [Pyrinomonadaceae bacterium]